MSIKSRIYCLLACSLCLLPAFADEGPTITPRATFIEGDEMVEDTTGYAGSAPLEAHFHANAENVGSWSAYYEWRFTKEGETEPYLIRYEEDTDYTFTDAGTHTIELYAIFTLNGDSVNYTAEYWSKNTPIRVTISESKLVMPNAFSPNDDGRNDVYCAKEYQSIVEFHATIYNRWGQKIYEWDDPADGWDGTFHGSPAKQGVYFVLVKAKGSDGRRYHIRKDVNLLRGYRETEGSSSTPTH